MIKNFVNINYGIENISQFQLKSENINQIESMFEALPKTGYTVSMAWEVA
jgi:hypothetical protein